MRPFLLLPLLLLVVPLPAATVTIARGELAMDCALPDPAAVGTRFDGSSLAPRARWRGRTLFAGYTHLNYPETNTAAGFAEEFDTGERSLPPGWAQARPGEAFLKLGVGALRKEGDGYLHWRTQPLAARGAWQVEHGPDWYQTSWRSPAVEGRACTLVRRVELRDDGFTVSHRLANTGSVALASEHYAHHFLCFAGRPVEPGYEIELGWEPPAPAVVPAPLHLAGRLVTIGALPAKWSPTDGAGIALAGGGSELAVRHRGAGVELRLRCRPAPARLVIYAAPQALCPEPFTPLGAEPGAEVSWSCTYTCREPSP
jgi:hypothetical protein